MTPEQLGAYNAGMPPLDLSKQPVSFFEFWPQSVFYAPIAVYWLYLSLRHGGLTLPTAANPGLPLGGLVGESKSAVYNAMGPLARSLVAPFISVHKGTGDNAADESHELAKQELAAAGLLLPLVAKPDIACRGAGVKLIKTDAQLAQYFETFPSGADILLQALIDKPGEAGVFYVRHPDEGTGTIPSLTLKYFPHVLGDGEQTVRELIMGDTRAGRLSEIYLPRNKGQLETVPAAGEAVRIVFAGNHSKGTIFRNGTDLVTPELTAKIDEIAKDITGYHFGRMDIRFSNFEAFLKGEDISLIEVNGAGGEQTHIWDATTTLPQAYTALFSQFRSAFEIGAANKRLGAQTSSVSELIKAFRAESALTKAYPMSD